LSTERLRQAIERKRPEFINRKGVIFYDNVKPPHIFGDPSKIEKTWKVLMHPPYNPDLAPSDYHLFRSLQNSLNGVKLTSKESENHLLQFFTQKSQKFYIDGIIVLPQK